MTLPDHHITKSNFQGLTVASFESRMAAEMTNLITRYGGRPSVVPALREIPLEHNAEALSFGEQLLAGQIDAVILLTGVGTTALVEVLRTRHPLETIQAALQGGTLIARGPKPVAALKALGLTPILTVPEPNTWRDVLRTLDEWKSAAGLRIAVQEYGVPATELVEGLRQRGATVIPVPVYRWAMPSDLTLLREALDRIIAGQVQVILLTNAAQIDHVMRVLEQDGKTAPFKEACKRLVLASIGPTASERLRRHGLPVDLEPSHPKMGILVKETSEQARELLARKRGTRNAE
jgi:uroporphyrinogen-III synthase